jgi:hypothetical protein
MPSLIRWLSETAKMDWPFLRMTEIISTTSWQKPTSLAYVPGTANSYVVMGAVNLPGSFYTKDGGTRGRT